MSTQEISPPAFETIAAPALPALHRFSVEQYHRMIETGVLTRADRVQLLEGVILDLTPIGVAHSLAVQGLMRALLRILPDGWDVFVQQPVSIEGSEPEPDLAVVRGSYSDYSDRHPSAADIALLIEVADTSLEIDQRIKARAYAKAGVQVYWLVNLCERQVEVRCGPAVDEHGAGVYQTCTVVSATAKLPLVLDGQAVGEVSLPRIFPQTG